MSELKRRLLLSKWHSASEKVVELADELAEAKEEIRSLEDDRDAYADQLQSALIDVRYWLHDGLVHKRIVSDPRRLLRKIEDVLG